jgi:membrane protease YdiL (CAAX protease family)
MTNEPQSAPAGFDPNTGLPLAPVPATPEPPSKKLLAPIWHTGMIIAIVLTNSFFTARITGKLTPHDVTSVSEKGRILQYAFTIGIELILLGLVWIGLRISGTKLRELIGGRWPNAEAFFMDVLIAAGFWVVAAVVLGGLGYLLGLAKGPQAADAKRLAQMLAPQSGIGLIIWILLSCTAGFVEEIVFRGYLQRQIAIISGNAYVGLISSALIFGGGHGYEGTRRMVLIAVFGAMFGILAHVTKSLRPAMMAHAWHDGFEGFLLRFVAQKALPPMH